MKINKSKIFHTHNTRAMVFDHLKNGRFNLLYSFFGECWFSFSYLLVISFSYLPV